MTLQHAASCLLLCACLTALGAATDPARVHEARQGPISIIPLTTGPGLASIQTSSSTSKTTMAPTTTTSSSSSRTSSATPQPSSTSGSLSFTVQNMTTCTSGLISWKYSGKDAELLLSVTNIDVPQGNNTLLRIKTRQSTVNSTIQKQLADTNTSAQSWTWPSVNLTQGWYEIQGLALSAPTVSNDSAPFFISNGSDVTCLAGTSSQASSTASPSTSVFPSSTASKTNVASIVGGVIGGLVGVTLAIIAAICLWSRRRKRPFVGSGGKSRKWGSLKSTNSSIQPGDGGTQLTNNRFHSHSESTGAILQDVAGGKASATTTPGGSDEDVAVASEEKFDSPVSSSGMSPFDALNTPVHYDRRASTYSAQTPTAVASEASRSRVPSVRASTQSLEQQAQRIRCSMETSNRRRSDRLSMPTLPSPALSRLPHSPMHAHSQEEYPLTPVTPAPVNRSISAGAVSMTARRTSRKPVPYYDSSILVEDKSADSVSTFTGGAESSQSHGTGFGAGAYGTPSGLLHKASFADGRPVHYLIPDMPPPPRD